MKQKSLTLQHIKQISGSISIPGSKSISNRVLLIASLCQQSTAIHGLLDATDTRVMLAALHELGVNIQQLKSTLIVNKGLSISADIKHKEQKLFMGNAGTVIRPLAAILTCINNNTNYILHGVERMHQRPIKDLVDGLRQIGANIDYIENEGYPPIKIKPSNLNIHKDISIKGNVSSQFLSSLLMALPITLNSNSNINNNINIVIEGELISKPYIDITLNIMQQFGIDVINHDNSYQKFTIPSNSIYNSPRVFNVEGDASSASYFIAAGVLASDDNGLKIDNIGSNSIQGDIKFVHALQAMGADITLNNTSIVCHKSQHKLIGTTIDCLTIPDAAMTLAIIALFAQGTTTLTNIASWRVKECDRIEAMHTELLKFGAEVHSGKDFIRITPSLQAKNQRISPTIINGVNTYDDHRMAMCFALCAFSEKVTQVVINDPECVEKTYPNFFNDLLRLSLC
jgi:3-phosphoshikimate 1-carboxyvinyltransferase